MALNANAVRVAGTGEVFVAPTGTAAPTDPTTPLPVAWVGMGYTSTDGVTFTMSRDTADIDAWQGSKLRTVTNAEPTTIEFNLMETNYNTLPVVFGGGTIDVETAPLGADGQPLAEGDVTYTPPAEGVNTIRSCVVEFKDGDVTYRYYFPRVQVEGDVSFSLTRSDAVGYSVTFGILASEPRWLLLSNDTELVDPALVAAKKAKPAAK